MEENEKTADKERFNDLGEAINALSNSLIVLGGVMRNITESVGYIIRKYEDQIEADLRENEKADDDG